MTKNEITLKESISNDYEIPNSDFDGRYTKTTLFLLPTLGINMYSRIVKPYFVNTFLDDREFAHDYTRPLFVLLRTKSLENINWKQLSTELSKKEEFILSYDCGMQEDYNLVMFVFTCPDMYKEEYYAFKKGQYTQFSTTYKKKFSETIANDEGNLVKSTMFGVINRTEEMKQKIAKLFRLSYAFVNEEMPELWELPRKEREYYRYKPAEKNGTDTSEKERSSEVKESTTI